VLIQRTFVVLWTRERTMNASCNRPNGREPLWTWVLALSLGGVAALVVPAAALFLLRTSSVLDLRGLEAEGDRVVAAIERYKKEDGVYPTSLEAAGINAPKSRWGDWQYFRRSDGTYVLFMGDYAEHHFTLYWTPRSGWIRRQ